jgi:hypothetical protein
MSMRPHRLHHRHAAPSPYLAWQRTAHVLKCLTMLFILGLILADCGSSPPPTSYVESSAVSLGFISWQQGSGNSIAGQWAQVTFDGVSSEPVASSSGFTGQLQNQQITITAATTYTSTGNLQDNTLRLSVTDTTGHVGTQVWYAASQAQYNELASAFTAYAHLRAALTDLSATVAHPPIDSDAPSYDASVQTARTYVGNLEGQERSIRSSSNPCGSTGLFDQLYPPDASLFQLTPFPSAQLAIAHTTIAQLLGVAQARWKEAQAQAIPTIASLPLPWKISARAESDSTQAGQRLYETVLATLQRDSAQMSDLQQRSGQIGREVQHIKRVHGC